MAKGLVIEARLDKGRGLWRPCWFSPVRSSVATWCWLVRATVVFAPCWTKRQEPAEAGPSIPVEIQGLTEVPGAGDEFMVLSDERRAREIATFRQGKVP